MFFLILTAQGQKHDYVWLLGQNSQANPIYSGTVVDFNTMPPDIYYEFRSMFFSQANASMCDTAGNLLFYTNGIYVANALHEPMENGMGLASGPEGVHNQGLYGYILTQGAMILPIPESSSKYCLLYMDKYFTPSYTSFQSSNIFFSIVDMALDGGHGGVSIKNHLLLNDALDMGRIMGTRHANGRDWWLLTRKYNTNEYYRILFDIKGLAVQGVQAVGSPIPSNTIGQSVFSPDGTKYACVHVYGLANPIYISIYDFDRCNGTLSNPIQFTYTDTASCAGVAISPNNRFLYVSSYRYVYQYDLHAEDIEASRIIVAVWDGFGNPFSTTFYLMQLAPDGKIYINSNNGVRYLHVINQPDSLGLACDVCQHCVELPSINALSLPNFPNYRLQHLEGSPCDTLRQQPVAEWVHEPLGLEVAFQDAAYHDIRAWHWSFGDGASDTVPNPVHSYAAEGTYNVCLAVSNPRGADTLCREVQVLVSSTGEVAGGGLRLEIFPNPAHPDVPATLIAEGLPATEVAGTVRDAFGRIVRRFSAPAVNGRLRQELDMRGLPAGVYFVELVSEKGVVLGSGKLVLRSR